MTADDADDADDGRLDEGGPVFTGRDERMRQHPTFEQLFPMPPLPQPIEVKAPSPVRLYNHTEIDSGSLHRVLTFAAEVAGVSGDVIVRVVKGRGYGVSGFAQWFACEHKETLNPPSPKGCIGWLQLRIPNHNRFAGLDCFDYARWAGEVVDAAIHEMVHVYDYRRGVNPFSEYFGRQPGKSRQLYLRAPGEIAARAKVSEVKRDTWLRHDREELIEHLAGAIEKAGKA